MIMKAKASSTPAEIETDVCVIGSGAGGAVMAKELAEGGLRVLVLEKGARFSKYDFSQREDEMFPLLYEDSGMRATADQSVIILHAKGVGGTTLVNDNICFRTPPFVLESWSQAGLEHMTPDAMVPYFEKVEKEISVRLIEDAEVSRNDEVFRRGVARLGLESGRFYHNRKDCIGCGFCYCGCSYDRKQNMALTYLPKAEAAGALVMPGCEVEEIKLNSSRQVESVLAKKTDAASGKNEFFRVRAKIFVAAGGSISTPVLLIRNGLLKLNPNIGRHLALHPIHANVGVMEESVRFYEGIPQCEYLDRLDRRNLSGFLLEGIGAHPILTSLILQGFGGEHTRQMADYENFSIHYVMLKDRPQGHISVNRFGNPVISYALHSKDVFNLREGMKLSAKIYFAAGARKVYLNHVDLPVIEGEWEVEKIDGLKIESNRMVLYSAHQLSTCRMGAQSGTSVTNSYGQFHGIGNLYISDASIIPTSLGVNPQVTIMALATRNAKNILNRQ